MIANKPKFVDDVIRCLICVKCSVFCEDDELSLFENGMRISVGIEVVCSKEYNWDF
jgi:Fe-S-cluster-containing dehydrogenase component